MGRRVPRDALFRLAADQQHEDVCPLNPVEVLQKIAHGSQGVAVVESDELHLVLPDDVSQIGASAPIIDTGTAAPGDQVGVHISTVRPLLPPLINRAVVIARFLQRHDYDADVVAQFKVRRPGETKVVGWGEFCHSPTPVDQARLYARLTSGAKPDHPVAVYGRVTAVEQDSQGRPVLRLADGHGFTVRIRSEHASLLEPLAVGTFVLAVGAWDVWTPRRGRPQLRMFAEEHWQLAHRTYDDATGRSSPPACPPPLSLPQRTLRQARATADTRRAGRAADSSPRPRPNRKPASAAPPPNSSPPVSPGPSRPMSPPPATTAKHGAAFLRTLERPLHHRYPDQTFRPAAKRRPPRCAHQRTPRRMRWRGRPVSQRRRPPPHSPAAPPASLVPPPPAHPQYTPSAPASAPAGRQPRQRGWRGVLGRILRGK